MNTWIPEQGEQKHTLKDVLFYLSYPCQGQFFPNFTYTLGGGNCTLRPHLHGFSPPFHRDNEEDHENTTIKCVFILLYFQINPLWTVY